MNSENKKDAALLVTRVIVGVIFVYAGWVKLADMSMTVGFFAQMGLGAFWAYLVTWVELVGGILLILGLWAWIAAILLSIVMIVAAYLSRSAGFAGMMPQFALLASLVALGGAGVGRFAVRLPRKSSSAVVA